MFTLNRVLDVLISCADKNLKVSGLLVGEELSVLSALHISTAAAVEKMQGQMHRWSTVEFWSELSLNENSPVLCFDSCGSCWKLEPIWARRKLWTGGWTIWGSTGCTTNASSKKNLSITDWHARGLNTSQIEMQHLHLLSFLSLWKIWHLTIPAATEISLILSFHPKSPPPPSPAE